MLGVNVLAATSAVITGAEATRAVGCTSAGHHTPVMAGHARRTLFQAFHTPRRAPEARGTVGTQARVVSIRASRTLLAARLSHLVLIRARNTCPAPGTGGITILASATLLAVRAPRQAPVTNRAVLTVELTRLVLVLPSGTLCTILSPIFAGVRAWLTGIAELKCAFVGASWAFHTTTLVLVRYGTIRTLPAGY